MSEPARKLPPMDFKAVAAAALSAADVVLAHWLPDGRRHGAEYIARNPTRDDRRPGSFSINAHTGAWMDGATGDKGGDLVALVAYLDGVKQAEAARRMAEFLRIDPVSAVPAVPRSRREKTASNDNGLHAVEAGTAHGTAAGPAVPARGPATEDWQPLQPVPDDAPPAPARHPRKGEPVRRWEYRDAAGRLLFIVCRFERPEGGKEVQPLAWGRLRDRNGKVRTGWHWKALPAPRPLYGLDRLAQRPAAPVVVCEGEKAADAAAELLPDFVATTSQNGSTSAGKADWRPLAGRRVLIWPDADAPGTAYAADVTRLALAAGAAEVRTLDLAALTDGCSLPDGWDAADALAEGWTAGTAAARLEAALCRPNPEPSQAATAAESAPAPAGFTVRTTGQAPGVYWQSPDDDAPPVWICAPLTVEALTRDAEGGAWGRLLAWEDRDGRAHRWAMPAALLAGDGAELRRELLAGGLAITSNRRERQRLEDYVAQARTEARVRCVERAGWHGDAYVTPTATYGQAAAERVLYQSETLAGHTLGQAGTLAGWRAHVAALCVGNSRLLFAVSVGFAALLLGRLGEESGGFHLRGTSSGGKTTALHVAASVFGSPDRYAQRWRATANGLEALASAHCDGLLILDELAQVDPREAGGAAYLLANNQGKARAGRSGGARPRASWRLLFLSAGEISLAEHMRSAGRRAHAGQEIRLADLDADAGRGHGLFETLHGRSNGAALSDEIRAAAERYHGTAGPALLSALVDELDRVPAAVETIRAAWLARHLPGGASGQARRVGRRFALIGAAGEIATGYGLTAWPQGAALDAAAACFRAWLEGRGGAGNAEPLAMLDQVRRFLLAHGEARFADLDGSDDRRTILNRADFRERTPAGGWRYLIPAEGWPEVCSGFEPRAVAALLAARGCLDTEDGRTTRRERLPGLGRVRCYVVTPHLFEDADDAPA